MFVRVAARTARPVVGRRAASHAAIPTPQTVLIEPIANSELIAERKAIQEHAAHSGALWRKITIFVAFPTIVAGYFNAENLAKEHKAHVEHLKEENGGELPPRIKYPYNTIRNKDFPWSASEFGNKTLFWTEGINLPVDE